MRPRQVEQGALFYEFSRDAHVPSEHFLRSIDRFVDLAGLRRQLTPFWPSRRRSAPPSTSGRFMSAVVPVPLAADSPPAVASH
jgi:hypothetical protein